MNEKNNLDELKAMSQRLKDEERALNARILQLEEETRRAELEEQRVKAQELEKMLMKKEIAELKKKISQLKENEASEPSPAAPEPDTQMLAVTEQISAPKRATTPLVEQKGKGNKKKIRLISILVLLLVAAGVACAFLLKPSASDVTFEYDGKANGYHYVDLGLPSGIKWASYNVGASKPEEYGGYYAWGETEEKVDYSWSTYEWCNGSYDTMTKYCIDGYYGNVDGKAVLDPDDDVAHVKWGRGWRMPATEEQLELLTQCTWKKKKLNGVNGYQVIGPNGKSIFLPAAGYKDGSELYARGRRGYYWPNSNNDYDNSDANCLGFDSDNQGWYDDSRRLGRNVRPVYDGSKPAVSPETTSPVNMPVLPQEEDDFEIDICEYVDSVSVEPIEEVAGEVAEPVVETVAEPVVATVAEAVVETVTEPMPEPVSSLAEPVEVPAEEEILDTAEEAPEFPGGMKALMNYLANNVTYPSVSRDNNSQGKAFVKFTVNSDGSIQDVEILRSSGDVYLDREAMRVVEGMPNWTPGRQDGKAVRVKFVIPINFRLQ